MDHASQEFTPAAADAAGRIYEMIVPRIQPLMGRGCRGQSGINKKLITYRQLEEAVGTWANPCYLLVDLESQHPLVPRSR